MFLFTIVKLALNSFVKANNLPLINSLNSSRGSLTVEEGA